MTSDKLISIDLESVVEDIYAESALGAVLGRLGDDDRVHVLSRDRHRALMRMVVQAASHVCAISGVELSEPVADSGQVDVRVKCDSGQVPAIRQCIVTAIGAAALQLVALSAGDGGRAGRYGAIARESAEAIAAIMARPRVRRRSY